MVDVSNREKRSGLITEKIAKWLRGKTGGQDEKFGLRRSLAYAMEDIAFLFEEDLDQAKDPGIDSINELFTHLDEETSITREECAKNLIALAYILTNDNIDYEKLARDISMHPRADSDLPRDSERSNKKSLVDFNQPVDDLLAFRRALAAGIKIGKEHVEDDDEGIPNIVCIDANTKLHKQPSTDELKEGFDGDDWKDVFATHLDGAFAENEGEDVIPREEAVEFMKIVIQTNIDNKINSRRNFSDSEIRQPVNNL